MRTTFIALMAAVLLQTSPTFAQSPAGDAAHGRALFSGAPGGALCMLCHGRSGDGGFGTTLAGRGITLDQVKKAVRDPVELMPRFPGIDDQGLADIQAFLQTLPKPERSGLVNVAAPPPGAPRGQVLAISHGCAQCHGPEMGHPRRDLGAKSADIDFATFTKIVYEDAPSSMGLHSREQIGEADLRAIWDFMQAMGQRAMLFASLEAGTAADGKATYTLTLANKGVSHKGLAAEDITVSLRIPEGLTVVSATGERYVGVKKGVETVLNPDQLTPFRGLLPNPQVRRGPVDFATWTMGKVAAGETKALTITLSGIGDKLPDFSGSRVTLDKPKVRRLSKVKLTDDRLAARGDVLWGGSQEFALPRRNTGPGQ